jgi:2-oxoglutarate ferredoxin oxidoreductase subunit beta
VYKTDIHPEWCPGCGDFAILKSLKNALFELQIDPSQTILVPGIGCSSKMMSAVGTYGLHTIHGRALPIATGVKIANLNLNVIIISGDGDALGIGGNHFIHAARRNVNMTYIVANNQNYGLTTGQASPTSDMGYRTKTSPKGTVESPLNPALLAVAAGATFVARSTSSKNTHLQEMIEKGIKHKGMAVIEVMQFCITFNKINTPDYYEPRLYDVQETDLDISSKENSLQLANQWGEKIPFGILHQVDQDPYEEQFPQLHGKSLVEKRFHVPRDVTSIFKDQR